MFRRIVRTIKRLARRVVAPVHVWRRMAPAAAFDLWSATYDDQVTNPLLQLDDELMERLLGNVSLEGKVMVDIGCGSGRRWPKLLAGHPERLIGCDASTGMLARLRTRYPDAELHRVTDHRLSDLRDESCDMAISTLTLGYIPDLEGAFREWVRVLKPAGDVVLTDLHPDAATPKARSFRQGDRTISIRHSSRSLASIRAAAERAGLEVLGIEYGLVGESIKPAYEAAGALPLYVEQAGSSLMFGMHLAKGAKAG
jgi:ubiquinone/menaquinone biosynthesis C-methylase UbiE